MKFPSYNDNFIVPSILSADFSCLKREVMNIEKYCGWIQIDVMDGHFVNNLSFGPHITKCVRKITKLPIDLHLMVEEPQKFIEPFYRSGVDLITVHYESKNFLKALKMIKKYNLKSGLAIKPKTSIRRILKYLDLIDLVLIMTVEPGFGGQSFIYEMLEKVKFIKDYITKNNIKKYIQVDGGINERNILYALNSGANSFVIGSALFNNKNPQFIKNLYKLINNKQVEFYEKNTYNR